MALDFSKIGPWNKITTVTLDGQQMVRIPKFYFGCFDAPAGSQHEGKKLYTISDIPREGLHIYPAFVKDNKVMDCFYYGAYEASMEGYPNGDHWDSTGLQRVMTGPKACSLPDVHVWNYVFNEEAKTACEARNVEDGTDEQQGWHLHNVYEVYAIAMLMLAEYGRTDFVDIIGAGNTGKTWTKKNNTYGDDQTMNTGTTDAVWRGVHELWGNVWEHYTGITTDEYGNLSILNHKMDGTYITTTAGFPSGGMTNNGSNGATFKQGWPVTFRTDSGDGYDLKDIFCPETLSSETYAQGNTLGSIHDHAWWLPKNIYGTDANIGYRPQTSGYCHGSFADSSGAVGPFVFNVRNGDSAAHHSFRLAKYGTATDEVAYED